MGIFGPLERATDFQDKLESKGVTEKMVTAAGSDSDKLEKIAAVFQDNAEIEIMNPYYNEISIDRLDRSYPAAYEPRLVEEQLEEFIKFFSMLDSSHILGIAEDLLPLEESEELLQVVPKLTSVSQLLRVKDPFGENYWQCLFNPLSILASQRPYLAKGMTQQRLDPNKVMVWQATREYLTQLENETPGDYLVLPIQSGARWSGYSVRNLRKRMERTNEIPMPAWVGLYHAISHPKRMENGLRNWDLNFPGDSFDFDGDGSFLYRTGLSFFMSGEKLGFSQGGITHPYSQVACASIFVR